ncbi:hypothetical protein K458DRAFT_332081 [Lentithecium fluviatile CBS 122367]|uniref:JmjC domain-containing histone demethylation protein 1 n=1 Tax=Lentithecium fluviatile CBS 122367 TaxID=1168545 RepID=A0A6G1JB14_9PLEO|nr:hypothetical protein K458DRAFT_332081 [Lentithecium fluviatile CBS 122367]
MRVSSFKSQYRQAPPRARTPPRPVLEPLSPVLRPNEAPIANPASSYGDSAVKPHNNGFASTIHHTPAPRAGHRAQLNLSPPAATYEQSLRSAPLPQSGTPYSPALGSPIEALADAAISSMNAGPLYTNSARRSSQAPISPATIPHPPGMRAPKHAYPHDSGHTFDGRPAKRARSEFFSPHNGPHYARPATSHIPGWSYNVEQMADNGLRMYQDNSGPAQHHEESNLKRLSDAQLLMDFAVSASSATPRPPPTAKRWSISHHEASPQYPQQQAGLSSPLPQASHTPYTRPPQVAPPPEYGYGAKLPAETSDRAPDSSTAQTQTPPEDYASAPLLPTTDQARGTEETKPKKHQGWPKGKPRGPRNGSSGGKKKKSTPKPKGTPSNGASEAPEQLHSPQSLPAEQQPVRTEGANVIAAEVASPLDTGSRARRHSFSNIVPAENEGNGFIRAQSVPLSATMVVAPPGARASINDTVEPDTICAGCNSTDSETMIGDGEQWIRCDGCKEWYHFVCAGFKSEREVRDVDKFYCAPCRPRFGETTKVRKSARAHTAVDYAGLNEGILKTSDDNPEHHYIAAFKNGDIEFTPEVFARLPPEIISADYLEKTSGFKEPILIPASLNPRPTFPALERPMPKGAPAKTDLDEGHYTYEMVPDDGQDKLDMVIPAGLTVRRVSELYGPQERVPVIDVKAQEGEDKRWTMAKWADYYEQQGEKPVRNVISLEVSKSRLGRLIRRPKAVRDMDLQDSVWRDDDKKAPPAVQFYCLMSVADCYTDFHIDFGGSSVYYHIVKGKKVFFFIPPTKQNLKKYEDWCLSPKQGHEWLGHQVKECYRVDLYPGDTMLIPSGWIHAVWTPEDSLVIGGNFLTRLHYGMQIKVLEIEKATKVAAKFRYPFFQKIMWLTVIKYLEEDPLPSSVEQQLLNGEQFVRDVPLYCETDRFGHNSRLGPQNYNRRYYAKAEIEGLTDLANYIWRTVLISLGRMEGITDTIRKAVTGSIPKGFGEPSLLAQRFAMWIAWKRGNETIPQWAYPDSSLPETTESSGEKKLSAAQVKRMEREAWGEALRATAERHSTRIKTTEPARLNGTGDQSTAASPPPPSTYTGFLQKTDPSRPLTTPKTSQLGPKRIACDACRKRRIRCKHKDELVETTKPGNGMNGGMNTIDLSGSLGLSVKRRYSDVDSAYGQPSNSADTSSVANGGPLLADVNADPYALKSGRVKACADCRKSKRRCIHDEYGNVDPIKANEVPIPRGAASKKRRISEEDSNSASRKMKREFHDPGLTNGAMHHRNSLPNALGMASTSELQNLAFSAQQALNQTKPEDPMPIDPSLQSYSCHADTTMIDAPSQPLHRDAVMSSIEHNCDGPFDGAEDGAGSTHRGPSVEPLTPGPTANDMQAQYNGFNQNDTSPQNGATMVAPPITPSAPRSARMSSSGRKSSRTPRPANPLNSTPKSTSRGRRRDSSIKMEPRSEQKARAMSFTTTDSPEDKASMELALKLAIEDHGLRRRSK